MVPHLTAEQLCFPTMTPPGLPARGPAIQVDVQNSWDTLAEAAIAAHPAPCAQLEHLALLLESHGVAVHRAHAPCAPSPRLAHAQDPYAPPIFMNGAVNGHGAGVARIHTGAPAPPPSLFPQNAALVYGTRVIEVPRPRLPHGVQQPNGAKADRRAGEHANALFGLLENAGVEVIRWPGSAHARASEGKLVDIDEATEAADAEEEGPRFSPSDILVLSPTLLIARLSPCTNNKGLEYLWTVLSRSAAPPHAGRRDKSPEEPAARHSPTAKTAKRGGTTTLLVRITEPEASGLTLPVLPTPLTHSPRSSLVLHSPKAGPTVYTPLSRALVPIDGHVMLFDSALVAEGEARRLKSVLDRLQEGPRGVGASLGEMSEIFAARSSRRDSAVSYGTFGSAGLSDEDGWQFISVEGLHTTSILFVSPRLALLSLAPPTSTTPSSPRVMPPNHDALARVAQVLNSLGIRTVALPFSEVNEKGGGVLDAVMVLRRESEIDVSDESHADREREQQQQQAQHDDENPWERSQAGRDAGERAEDEEEGCLEALTASIGAFFRRLFGGGSAASET